MRWKLSRTILRGASGGNITRLLDQKQAKGAKHPFYFLKEKEVFGFAGLWEEWVDKDSGEMLESCTIITTMANAVLEPIHYRMPVILQTGDYDRWFGAKETDSAELQKLLSPYPASEMASHAVPCR